jgi:uncharacterized protein (TIGR00255 family)
MVQSMTGMGTAECNVGEELITIEMKTVNHRYCDVSIRTPKSLSQFDLVVTRLVRKRFTRGKIDVVLRMAGKNGNSGFSVNYDIAQKYYEALCDLKKNLKLKGKIRVDHLARNFDLFRSREFEQDKDTIWKALESGLNSCCDVVNQMRQNEGKEIEKQLNKGVENISSLVGEVEKFSDEVKSSTVEKMHSRLSELLGKEVQVDEQRIVQEAGFLVDRMDISEEINRLRGHCAHFLELMDQSGAIGRKLDFLTQEMYREANTVASKCSDLRIARLSVDLKSEIEKVREQVQNVE